MKKLMTATLTGAMLLGVPTLATFTSMNSAVAATDNYTASKRLNALLSKTKSITANFSQTTKGSSAGGTYSGTMAVQRPSKFRWETTSPADQLVVASGSKLWVYDKDLEQATVQSVNNQVGNTPALLLSGDPSKISSNFKVTQPYSNKNYYVLYPKSSSANFRNMSIAFSGGKPVMMVLNDNLGQTTSIKFSNITLNPSISSSKFTFTPPKGVDVISQ